MALINVTFVILCSDVADPLDRELPPLRLGPASDQLDRLEVFNSDLFPPRDVAVHGNGCGRSVGGGVRDCEQSEWGVGEKTLRGAEERNKRKTEN